jgi:organic radical activating enzyme
MQVGQIVPKKSYTVLSPAEEGGISYDYMVTLRITEACDLKCNYCHWHSGKHYAYEDIITTIDKLFEFFQKQKFKSVLFYYHGGEPTRHPKCLDILKYIHQKGAETGINAYNEMQTNLTIKDTKLIEMLPYCDQFNASFHYLELKRLNKLKDFDHNWQVLKELGIPIHNMDIMMENVERGDRWYQGKTVEVIPEEFYAKVVSYLEYEKIQTTVKQNDLPEKIEADKVNTLQDAKTDMKKEMDANLITKDRNGNFKFNNPVYIIIVSELNASIKFRTNI